MGVGATTLTFGGLLLFGNRLSDVFGRSACSSSAFSPSPPHRSSGGRDDLRLADRAGKQSRSARSRLSPRQLPWLSSVTPSRNSDSNLRAVGVYAAVSSAGGALGLLLGSALTDIASWQWVPVRECAPPAQSWPAAAPRALSKSAGAKAASTFRAP